MSYESSSIATMHSYELVMLCIQKITLVRMHTVHTSFRWYAYELVQYKSFWIPLSLK